MATNVFNPPSVTQLPKDDPRVIRVDLETNEMGARKTHLPRDGFKNDQSIVHVASGRSMANKS